MRCCVAACLLIVARTSVAAEPVPCAVPDGFTIEKAAQSPLIQRPIFAAFDEAGFLFVGESSGENLKRDDMLAKKPHWITRLEDTDGDGVFDKSIKFVEGITLPQGMLCYRGSVYAACPPSLWKFTDTDGDGKADEREEILTGFGFSGNACDTHGPFLSPTGRLYIAQGRHGHEFKDKDGKTYSKGKAARIYSCRLDGSDVRVHCGGGFDNPVEIDFTEEGEAIGTVNILYRDRGDCLMHWVEGGVYPREDQADCVAEFKWTGGLLGPVHNLGHVACSGLMRYRGVHFGEEFKNRWFFTEFNTHKVRFAELKRSGSTFTADVHEFLTSSSNDFHPTDVLEDADGSLLVVNTGAWFLNGCPTSKASKPEDLGAIWRIRKTGGTKLDDPRGRELQFQKKSPTVWMKHLGDPRPALREQAIDLLAQISSADEENLDRFYLFFIECFKRGDNPLHPVEVRWNAIWAMARRRGEANRPKLLASAADLDPDDSPRMAALEAMAYPGNREQPEYRGVIRPLVTDSPPLRLAAATCIARVAPEHFRNDQGVQTLLSGTLLSLRSNVLPGFQSKTEVDPTLKHALMFSVIQIDDRRTLVRIVRTLDPLRRAPTDKPANPAVVCGAVIALDQMDNSPLTREMVVPLLSTDDPALLAVVLEVISRREGWGAETLSLFKEWLREGEASAERLVAVRSFLTAQARDAGVQRWIADALTEATVTGAERVALLEVMQQGLVEAWPDVWTPPLRENLKHPHDDVRLKSLEVVMARDLGEFVETVRDIGGTAQPKTDLRGLAFAFVLAHQKSEVAHCLFFGGAQRVHERRLVAPRASRHGARSRPRAAQRRATEDHRREPAESRSARRPSRSSRVRPITE